MNRNLHTRRPTGAGETRWRRHMVIRVRPCTKTSRHARPQHLPVRAVIVSAPNRDRRVKTSHKLPPASARYGLALASVAALALAHALACFDLTQPFATLALFAMAITFSSGGSKPGDSVDSMKDPPSSYVNLPGIVETNESAGRGTDGLRHR
jgi:hypothetical protein